MSLTKQGMEMKTGIICSPEIRVTFKQNMIFLALPKILFHFRKIFFIR